MWEIDLADQLTTLALSLPVGLVFSAVFYLFEGVKTALCIKGLRLWVYDMLYFILLAFATFCFLLVRSNGEVRGYILAGMLGGFWLYKILFKKATVKISAFLSKALLKIFGIVYASVNRITFKIYRKIRKTKKIFRNMQKKG